MVFFLPIYLTMIYILVVKHYAFTEIIDTLRLTLNHLYKFSVPPSRNNS